MSDPNQTYRCGACANKAATKVALQRQCRYPKELTINSFPAGQAVIAEAVYTPQVPAGFDLVVRQVVAYVGQPNGPVLGAARILLQSPDRDDESFVLSDSGVILFASSFVEEGFDGRPFFRVPVTGDTRRRYRVRAQLLSFAVGAVPAGQPPTRLLTQLGYEPSWGESE